MGKILLCYNKYIHVDFKLSNLLSRNFKLALMFCMNETIVDSHIGIGRLKD